ncbi:MAG: translesion DNA synthesis-associated protein ImuA [Alcaligenaceae bacterium]|nr:MAG: translesion DNA synthesis-associated protein ImuA [Alcaligenaceae bacterium]
MLAPLCRVGEASPDSTSTSLPASRGVDPSALGLPPRIEAALWRGDQIGTPIEQTVPTGFHALDAALPGAGWPCRSLTELLQVQPAVAEWRLLAPAMRGLIAQGKQIVIVGPPRTPHLPGLHGQGVDERHLVWIRAEAPLERLWVTEQLVRANAAGMVLAWLPQARQEQIRRLQVCAQSCDAPVVLCRPITAASEPSAAPLRIELRFGLDWELRLNVIKRKGASMDDELVLPSVPASLDSILTPRVRRPSELIALRQVRENQELFDVVGRPASRPPATAQRSRSAH